MDTHAGQQRIALAPILNPGTRLLLKVALVLILAAMLFFFWTIPFVYQSFSLLYKSGWEIIVLRGGKILGITAGLLLFAQPVLAARLHLLDRIFSLPRLQSWHRTNGLIIGFLGVLHGFLILAAEKFIPFPLEWRYWPEFAGSSLLTLLLVFIFVAWLRTRIGLAYEKWRSIHRPGGFLLVLLAVMHVLYVSDPFQSFLPRVLILLTASPALLLAIRATLHRVWQRRPGWTITAVKQLSGNTTCIEVRPSGSTRFRYAPGQFAFITPGASVDPQEEHPFTLCSSPSRPDTLQFVIRACGDGTS